MGSAAGRCGPTVSGRWNWWTSRRSAGRCGSYGTSTGSAARIGAVGRVPSPSRTPRSPRRGRSRPLGRDARRPARLAGRVPSTRPPQSRDAADTRSTRRGGAPPSAIARHSSLSVSDPAAALFSHISLEEVLRLVAMSDEAPEHARHTDPSEDTDPLIRPLDTEDQMGAVVEGIVGKYLTYDELVAA